MTGTDQPTPLSPSAALYRDSALGMFSSHPYWQERGARLFQRIVIGSLALVYTGAFYVWLRVHSLGELFNAVVAWISGIGGLAFMAAMAFCAGMLAAASFQLRWAMHKLGDEDAETGSDRPGRRLYWPVLGLLVAIGVGLPLVLTLAPGLPAEVRLFGALMALLPVAGLSYLLVLPSDPRVGFPFVSMAFTVSALAVAFAGSVILQMVLSVLPGRVLLFFPVLASLDGLRKAFLVVACGVALIALFKLALWHRSRSLARKTSPVADLLAKPDQPPKVDIDAWAAEVAARLEVSKEDVRTVSPGSDEVTDWQEESPFQPYFEGTKPTRDQHKVMMDFSHLARSRWGAAAADAADCGFEMILEGPSGSGRTACLDALALVSVVEYGVSAVLFVPDEGRVRLATDRLLRKIASLHLQHFLIAEPLEAAANGAGRKSWPDICVTTVAQWEKLLPGSREKAERENVRSSMCRYATVLVDDWLEHPLPVQLHLPFVVDKHRLLLESEMVPSARVFAFPRLTDTGRRLVVDRIIGHGGLIDEARQAARLRYRKELTARVIDLEVADLPSSIDRVANELSTLGRPTALLRQGVDAEEAERQTEDLRTRFPGSAITVCYCYDQFDALVGPVSSIVMKAMDGPDAVFAACARQPQDGLVIIRVRSAREAPLPAVTTPLIVERTGRGIAEAHLYNILRLIEPRTPAPQRAWGQLWGLPGPNGKSPPNYQEAGRLLLDRPKDIPEQARLDRRYLEDLEAFLALDSAFTRLYAIDCHWIQDPGPPLWLDRAGGPFGPNSLPLPEPTQAGGNAQTTVAWIGNDRAELGRSQLHYMDQLLLRRKQVFCPEILRVDPHSGIQIEAARFRDNGQDAIHPKLDLSWSVADAASCELPDFGYGGPDHGYLWIGYRQAHATLVLARLTELTNDLDSPTPCPAFEFSYRVGLQSLVLGPTLAVIDEQQQFREAFQHQLATCTSWGTSDSSFLPGVTYALTRGLELDLPGSAYLGKMLAFRCNDALGKFGQAIVWFVEPEGTGGTVSNAVQELLKGDGYLRQLATRMDTILTQGWDKSSPSDLARFWLPRRLRASVSVFERSLVKRLLDPIRETEQPGEAKTGGTEKW